MKEAAYIHLIRHALNSGYVVSVVDGDECDLSRSTDPIAIIEALQGTEGPDMHIIDPKTSTQVGWAMIVLGWGLEPDETVADYGCNDYMDAWFEEYHNLPDPDLKEDLGAALAPESVEAEVVHNDAGVAYQISDIKDLWHVAEWIENETDPKPVLLQEKKISACVLEVWHQAHAMRDEIRRLRGLSEALVNLVNSCAADAPENDNGLGYDRQEEDRGVNWFTVINGPNDPTIGPVQSWFEWPSLRTAVNLLAAALRGAK